MEESDDAALEKKRQETRAKIALIGYAALEDALSAVGVAREVDLRTFALSRDLLSRI